MFFLSADISYKGECLMLSRSNILEENCVEQDKLAQELEEQQKGGYYPAPLWLAQSDNGLTYTTIRFTWAGNVAVSLKCLFGL